MKSILLVWMFISSFLLFFGLNHKIQPETAPERILNSVRV